MGDCLKFRVILGMGKFPKLFYSLQPLCNIQHKE